MADHVDNWMQNEDSESNMRIRLRNGTRNDDSEAGHRRHESYTLHLCRDENIDDTSDAHFQSDYLEFNRTARFTERSVHEKRSGWLISGISRTCRPVGLSTCAEPATREWRYSVTSQPAGIEV